MSTIYEIPLSSEPQSFSVDLGGTTYRIIMLWNIISSVWTLDFYNKDEAPVLRGVPLVANVDLLAAYPHLNFGGTLIAKTDDSPDTPPTFDNLGLTGHLYFEVP